MHEVVWLQLTSPSNTSAGAQGLDEEKVHFIISNTLLKDLSNSVLQLKLLSYAYYIEYFATCLVSVHCDLNALNCTEFKKCGGALCPLASLTYN